MVFALLSVVTVKAITLSGNVQDASANEPLPQASVRLLSQRDSSLVKGVVTDNNGRFRINGVKAGRYIVEASYVGFTPVLRNVTVADKDITLKAFELTESSIMLSEAVVKGIRTPIKVMEDTVEYNTDSYRPSQTPW